MELSQRETSRIQSQNTRKRQIFKTRKKKKKKLRSAPICAPLQKWLELYFLCLMVCEISNCKSKRKSPGLNFSSRPSGSGNKRGGGWVLGWGGEGGDYCEAFGGVFPAKRNLYLYLYLTNVFDPVDRLKKKKVEMGENIMRNNLSLIVFGRGAFVPSAGPPRVPCNLTLGIWPEC